MASKNLASPEESRTMIVRELDNRFGLALRDGSRNWKIWELETAYNTLEFAGFSREFFSGIELSEIRRDIGSREQDGHAPFGVYYDELPRGRKCVAVFDGLYETSDTDLPPKTEPSRRLAESLVHNIAHAWLLHDREMEGKDFQYARAEDEIIEKRLKGDIVFAESDFALKQGRKFSSFTPRRKTVYMTGVLAEGNLKLNRRVNEFARLSGWQGTSYLTGEAALFRDGSLDGLYAYRAAPKSPGSIPTEYGRTSVSEDFAESVRYYVFYPKELLRVSPEKYRYIRANVFHGREFSGYPHLPSAIGL